MTCKCKNEDGSMSQTCLGTCRLENKIIDLENNTRDPMNGFAELILAQLERRIDHRLAKFRLDLHDEFIADYKQSLLEGFREGFEMAREIYE